MTAFLLATLLLVDAGLAGFRAATGRNARIRKHVYYRTAIWRGFSCGGIGLVLIALFAVMSLDGTRYGELVRAGTRMLQVLIPFAAMVVLSLFLYWLLPMRGSTFVILIGLGPFTLVRPLVVAAAVVWTVVPSGDWLVWTVAIAAAGTVLTVEPVVHRRWYRSPV